MTSVIYCILNLENGKHYVGSAVNFLKRRKVHCHLLRKGTHRNPKLQNAWRKYGESAFRFDILERVDDIAKLIEREQFWLDQTIPFYNIARIASSPLGTKRTKEQRERMSLYWSGRKKGPQTIEQRNAHSKASTGQVKSNETKAKIGAANSKYLFEITAPDSTSYVTSNMNQFCNEHEGLHTCAMFRVAHGQQPKHKGWTVRILRKLHKG